MQLMRGPLIRVAAAVLLVAAAGGGAAAVDVEAASRLTLFREPSRTNGGIRVYHPQTEVSATGDVYAISAGYELDMVSGATPAIFGADDRLDAISAPTSFSDLRQEVRGGLGVETPLIGLEAGYSYGWESDYRSHTVSAGARGDFLERNFTLGLAYTRNFDSICDRDNRLAQAPIERQPLTSSDRCFRKNQDETITRGLATHTFEPTLVWTATPLLLLQAGATLQVGDGFQSNPYRRVALGTEGRTPQEHLPTLRQRYALFALARHALPAVRGALSLQGRAYRDTWDVRAATVEAGHSSYLGPSILVSLVGRYHLQTGARFSRTAPQYRLEGPNGRYWTGDRELSPLSAVTGGAKLAYLRRWEGDSGRWIDALEIDVRFDMSFYDLEAGAPNSGRRQATIAQAGLSVTF